MCISFDWTTFVKLCLLGELALWLITLVVLATNARFLTTVLAGLIFLTGGVAFPAFVFHDITNGSGTHVLGIIVILGSLIGGFALFCASLFD